MILENGRQNTRNGQGGTVECMDWLGFAVFATKADVGPAGLKVSEIAATGNLQPSFLAGSPYLEVELLGVGEADVARANQQDPIGKFEFLKQAFGILPQGLELVETVVRMHPFTSSTLSN